VERRSGHEAYSRPNSLLQRPVCIAKGAAEVLRRFHSLAFVILCDGSGTLHHGNAILLLETAAVVNHSFLATEGLSVICTLCRPLITANSRVIRLYGCLVSGSLSELGRMVWP
jgi:hypothetical protein